VAYKFRPSFYVNGESSLNALPRDWKKINLRTSELGPPSDLRGPPVLPIPTSRWQFCNLLDARKARGRGRSGRTGR